MYKKSDFQNIYRVIICSVFSLPTNENYYLKEGILRLHKRLFQRRCHKTITKVIQYPHCNQNVTGFGKKGQIFSIVFRLSDLKSSGLEFTNLPRLT